MFAPRDWERQRQRQRRRQQVPSPHTVTGDRVLLTAAPRPGPAGPFSQCDTAWTGVDCFHLTSALRPSPRRWVFANSIRKILTYFPSTYVYLRLFRDGSSILTAAACGVAGRASPLHMFYSTDTLVCCIFVFCILSGIKFRNLRSVSGDCWRTSWLAGWLCAPPYWLAPRPCRHPCRRPLSCPLPHVSPLRLQPEHRASYEARTARGL